MPESTARVVPWIPPKNLGDYIRRSRVSTGTSRPRCPHNRIEHQCTGTQNLRYFRGDHYSGPLASHLDAPARHDGRVAAVQRGAGHQVPDRRRPGDVVHVRATTSASRESTTRRGSRTGWSRSSSRRQSSSTRLPPSSRAAGSTRSRPRPRAVDGDSA